MGNIHKYIYDGNYIVLDVNSGGVHLVDELTFSMLDYLETAFLEAQAVCLPAVCPELLFQVFSDSPPFEIEECYSEIYELYSGGSLFSKDGYEQFTKDSLNAPLKALCLHVAHDCNLNCAYCFAGTGNFGGECSLMSSETAKKAVDFLIENSSDREYLEIDFFGGEPLMAWDTIKQTVNYARSKKEKRFNFTITTNGLLLDDEKIDFINNEMSNVVLSLDGRREINDIMRKTKSGDGSYDLIVTKYKKLIESRTLPGRTEYYIRGTFTKKNLDFCEDILSIRNEGFSEISLEPAIVDEALPFSITRNDVPRIKDEYDRLYELMSKPDCDFNFFHFNIDLSQGPCVIKRLRGCGCGNEYTAITPNGDIYPCHQFVGIERWKMGNIINNAIDLKIKEYFYNTHVYSKRECKNCWAKFYCSGGCNAISFIYCGDVKSPHELSCELMKKRIECAIALNISSIKAI